MHLSDWVNVQVGSIGNVQVILGTWNKELQFLLSYILLTLVEYRRDVFWRIARKNLLLVNINFTKIVIRVIHVNKCLNW